MHQQINSLQNINFPKNKESAFFLGIFGIIFTGALVFKQKKGSLLLSQSYNDFALEKQQKQNKGYSIDNTSSGGEDEEDDSESEQNALYLEDNINNKDGEMKNKQENLQQKIKKSFKAKTLSPQKKSQHLQLRNSKLMEKVLGVNDIKQKDKIRVLVTSQNQEKIQAIESALKDIFPEFYQENGKVIIQAQKSESGISHGQPWGLQHTYEGANNRLECIKQKMQQSQVFEKLNSYDLIISIENGVFPLMSHSSTRGYDIACVIVERKVDKQKQQQQQSQLQPAKLSEKEQKEKDQKLQQTSVNLFGSSLKTSKSNMQNFLSQQQENGNKSYLGQNQIFSWDRQIGFSSPRLYPLQNVQMQIQSGKSHKEMGKYVAQYYENKQFSQTRHDQIKDAIINTLCQFI